MKTANRILKMKYRKKMKGDDKEEPPWMNEEIRREIAKRRKLNKKQRKCHEGEVKERAWNEYLEQKNKVRRLVKEEMECYENRIADKIKNMKGKEMWKMIRVLKGERTDDKKEVRLFTAEGQELEEEKYEREIRGYWGNIYRKYESVTDKEWNERKIIEYEESLEVERAREEDPGELWLPRIGQPYRNVKVMKFDIKERDVEKIIQGLKNKRAGGNDGATPEMYKELGKSKVCVKTMRDGFERVMERGGEPEGWRESRTVMLPKSRKPTVSDLRPIALTEVAYKIFMKIIKEKIEHHIVENGVRREEQAGVYKRRRDFR